MRAIRITKVILALSIGVWGLSGLIGNLVSAQEIHAEVVRVTSMAGVPEGEGPPWRTSNSVIAWFGVLAIVLGKVAATVGGLGGGVLMAREWQGTAADFEASKSLAIAGCGLAFALSFAAFTVFAESVFFMFYDRELVGAAELAFRFSASFALATLFIAQGEPRTGDET